ncbi:hypothetical protein AALA24_13685 [Anaerovoracaceae bacterium 42-11]
MKTMNLKSKAITVLLCTMLVFSFSIFASAETNGDIAGINKSGETYGTYFSEGGVPDLIAAVATNGKSGYIKQVDLDGKIPDNPKDALELQKNQKSRVIPVYKEDGTTVIGGFVISKAEEKGETLVTNATKSAQSNEKTFSVGSRTYYNFARIALDTSNGSATSTVKLGIKSGTSVPAGYLGVMAFVTKYTGKEVVAATEMKYNSSDHCSSYITSASYKTKSGTYYAWGRTHVWNGEKYVLQTTLNSPNQNF